EGILYAEIDLAHIMELLRFDAVGQIDLGVENPLVPAERVSQGRASRVEHYRDPPGRLLQDAYRPPAEGRFDGVPERSVEARRGHHVEDLRFETVRAGPDADGLRQVVVAGPLRRSGRPDRRVAGDVKLLALRHERE